MLDSRIRPLIDPPLNHLAKRVARFDISADTITMAGLALCLPLFVSLYNEYYMAALFFLCLNRLTDGLDGPVARHSRKGPTDFGGYFDIIGDFIFYSGFVFFFIFGRPEYGIYGAFLLFSFFGSATSFLSYAVIAAKRNLKTEKQGQKSFYYMSGLAEGSETIIVFVLICLFPAIFPLMAVIFGIMCWITALGRTLQAYKNFG